LHTSYARASPFGAGVDAQSGHCRNVIGGSLPFAVLLGKRPREWISFGGVGCLRFSAVTKVADADDDILHFDAIALVGFCDENEIVGWKVLLNGWYW
jgi:hypothetical protein